MRKQIEYLITNNEMIELYENGATLKEVSKIAGCGLETVRRRLIKAGIDTSLKTTYSLNIPKEEILRLYDNELQVCEIAEIAGCTSGTISYHLTQLGVVKRDTGRYNLNISKSEILRLYNEGVKTSVIAEIAGCGTANISNHLNNMGISSDYRHRQYFFKDEDMFKYIDTEEKAYILGLLYADGNNSTETYTVSIGLKLSDISLIERVRDVVYESDRPIHIKGQGYGEGMAVLSISSKIISHDLENLGVVKAKSLILTYPDFYLGDLESHFIRGYFDGDGCTTTKNRFSFIGTYEFITGVQDSLYKNAGIDTANTRKNKKNSNSNTYVFEHGGKIAYRDFYDYIYKDATIYLERKHQRFLDTFEEWVKRGVDVDNLVKNAKYPKLDIQLQYGITCHTNTYG